MATIIETREFMICQHYVCLLEYGNEGGYTDEDEDEVNAFYAAELKLPEGARHWTFEYGDEPAFAHCEIAGCHGDCVTLTAHAFGP